MKVIYFDSYYIGIKGSNDKKGIAVGGLKFALTVIQPKISGRLRESRYVLAGDGKEGLHGGKNDKTQRTET